MKPPVSSVSATQRSRVVHVDCFDCRYNRGKQTSIPFALGGRHAVPMQRLALLFAASFLILAGCTSDTSLRLAPPPDAEDLSATSGPADGPDFGEGDAGAGSPWANLDPGEIPDDLFAVAWMDLTVDCWNCTYAPNSPNRYDLVDALGRVVSSFGLPFEWQDDWYLPELAAIHASGPGRFVVSNFIYVDSGVEQVVWEADAFADTATVIARVRTGEVELPLAGVTVPLPIDSWPQDEVVLPDPTDPGRLLIVPTSSSPYLPSEFSAIWSLSTSDPDALVRTWTLPELLPPALLPASWDMIEAPWHASLAADGSGQLVLGMTGWETLTDPDSKTVQRIPRPILLSLDLDAPEERWLLPVDGLELSHDLRVTPPSPDQQASILWIPGYCGDRVLLWEEGATAELPLPVEDQCPIMGPLLDAPSRSFIYTAWNEEPEWPGAQRLVVSHQGEEVWSLDRLRVGLSERPFLPLGVARVAQD